MDQAASPPAENIHLLAREGLLGLSTPARFGGIGAPPAVLRAYTEVLAAACGLTAFVQGQHQSAALLVAGGENDDLKSEWLPRMATGETFCGVAFSHLRRKGEPVVRAREDSEGYLFDGDVPWVTGCGLIDQVVLGGTLEDGRLLYVLAPLVEDKALMVSPPMRLCAMNASGTVSLTCRGFRVPRERYLKTITRQQMAENDLKAILAVTPQPLGAARASIQLLREIGEGTRNPLFTEAAVTLEAELERLRTEVDEWALRSAEPEFREHALGIRAQAISHGVRCAHAALAASGGRGNSLDHPAQRLFREAMFYTLTAQTPDVQTATLLEICGSLAVNAS